MAKSYQKSGLFGQKSGQIVKSDFLEKIFLAKYL